MRPSLVPIIVIIIMSAAISVSTLVSYTATITSFFPIRSWIQKETILSSSSLVLSEVKGGKGDVKPIQIYRTKVIPGIKDYYDILSVSVMKINNKLSFVMDLAGDPNKNEKYETTYIWLIYYNTSSINRNSASQNEEIYTLLIPNFAADSNFSLRGWYTAIFNNTANTYNLPLTRISEMPKDKVGVDIDPSLIGNPASFNYMTCVMVRVNSTFLNKPPDYLMDSVPHNDRFWEGWWAR
jgi:hypothetical protein